MSDQEQGPSWMAPAIFLSLGLVFALIHVCVMRKVRSMKTDDEDGTAMSMIKASARSFDEDEMYDDDNFEDDIAGGTSPRGAIGGSGQYGSTADMPV